MPCLSFNNYSTSDDTMKEESGDRSNPIWLVVNPKYPVVRHNIWTPILDSIQDNIYRKLCTRIDTGKIFIMNAVSNIGILPNTFDGWEAGVAEEIVTFRESVLEHQPKILITFGIVSYEFVKRVTEIRPEVGPKYWRNTDIANEFERSIANFDINKTNRIPLLRRVMKNGKYIAERNYYGLEDGENYFRDVGAKIAARIIENKDHLKIWIK